MGFPWKRSLALVVLLVAFYYLDSIKHHGYIFEPKVLQEVAQSAIAKNYTSTAKTIDHIVKALDKHYPGHVNKVQEWVFNNAGHTGRFLADDYFIILEGEQWAFYPGAFEKEVYTPGHMHHLPRGFAQQYRMPDKCWALEYARGWIPLMLPFGLADTFSSTLDFYTLAQTFKVYGKCVINELLQNKF
ncbi:C8 sterol isomerase [Acanthamoeba castellanii str. Neff]|uniref:C8 sterol isomerase n=1 Tax=Acanthamoeba castellanii (strain ATCC 30010 / Neff) TaxID=1257118 RepID=L8GHW5_ACACF|nr:C8 sterol isomerase [Acanthamoeba castellanii str. Neff]ELR12353.1 C8 sterol isomerase [Acanthamoeba castellanii str. Neff]